MDEPIVRLPPVDKWVGSCPVCGKNVWYSYLVHPESENLKEVYRCPHCKEFILKENLIPFRPLKL